MNKKLHPFTLLISILIITSILANFIPSGEYSHYVEDGVKLVDPKSFTYIEKEYIGVGDFFKSFYYGFVDASSLMAIILFSGACFGVINGIGIFESFIIYLIVKLRDFPYEIFSGIFMLVIGLFMAFTGLWELSVVVIPIVIPLILGLGYDLIAGAGLVILPTCAGFGASFTNPLFVAIAHDIAGLPIYSGLYFRFISFSLVLLISYIYYISYCKKIKTDPKKSIIYGFESKYRKIPIKKVPIDQKSKRAGLVFIIGFIFLVVGTVLVPFGFAEIAASFITIGFIVGISYGLNLDSISHYMSKGMKDLFDPAIVMIFARAIIYIMNESNTIATIIHFFSSQLVGKNLALTGVLILLVQYILNFFIPSGSGQAALTLPILLPIGDIAGLNRQIVVLASQFGDGFSNFIYPTNGTLFAILMASDIDYKSWFKFFFPLYLMIFILSIILVIISVYIDYGPF